MDGTALVTGHQDGTVVLWAYGPPRWKLQSKFVGRYGSYTEDGKSATESENRDTRADSGCHSEKTMRLSEANGEKQGATSPTSRRASVRPGSVRISRCTPLNRKAASARIACEIKPLSVFTAPMGMEATTARTLDRRPSGESCDLSGLKFTQPLRTLKVVQVLPGGLRGALQQGLSQGTKEGVMGASSASLGHSSEISCLRVSPSGTSLLSGDTYGRVVHWTLNKNAVKVDSVTSRSQVEEEIGELM